jgi:hypothetical protein
VIVFSFLKRAISKITLNKRLGAIISQNPFLKNSLHRVKMLKRPQTKSIKAVILGFGDPKAANKAINREVF